VLYARCANLVRWFSSESRCARYTGALGPKWLSGKVFDPPSWCGEVRKLCAGMWRPPPLVEMTSRWPRVLASAFVAKTKWQVKLALGETWWSGSNTLCVECFNNVNYGWLSAYRYHKINHLSRVCFISSLFTFPHFILAIFVCLYFHSVVFW
jgi:hypothetical protein